MVLVPAAVSSGSRSTVNRAASRTVTSQADAPACSCITESGRSARPSTVSASSSGIQYYMRVAATGALGGRGGGGGGGGAGRGEGGAFAGVAAPFGEAGFARQHVPDLVEVVHVAGGVPAVLHLAERQPQVVAPAVAAERERLHLQSRAAVPAQPLPLDVVERADEHRPCSRAGCHGSSLGSRWTR